jgi:hypothetical protein
MVVELDELQQASRRANTRYLLKSGKTSEDLMKQAAVVLGDLTATIEFVLDDDVDTEQDVALEQLEAAHDSPTTQDSMALALEEFADLGDEMRGELDALGTFDVADLAVARDMAKRLRQRSAPRASDDEIAQAQRLRNQLWTLLLERMRRVRRTARLVFRHHPEIAQQATSQYQRRLRAEARRRERASTRAAARPAN